MAQMTELRKEKDTLSRLLNQTHDERITTQEELKTASSYIEKIEKRVLEANSQGLDLLKRLRNMELENNTLRDYIIDLKGKIAVYVPIKGDAIDMKLAEYINNYPDRSKLKIMFMREHEGLYSFGSKRVHIRIEKGRILVRIGGGYATIDEFLD